jgi:hypothetical protein
VINNQGWLSLGVIKLAGAVSGLNFSIDTSMFARDVSGFEDANIVIRF